MVQHMTMKHQSKNKPKSGKPSKRGGATSAPIALGTTARKPSPKISVVKDGTRVVNKEAITLSFAASSATSVKTVPLNTKADGSLPWLGNTALNYDKVRFNSVRVDYISLNPTTEGGDVIMYFDTDASDAAPTSYDEAFNAGGCKSGRLWDEATLNLTKADLHAQKEFTTTGETTTGLLGSPGNIQVFATRTGATTSAADYGRLVITYDVTLTKPEKPKTVALAQSLIAPNRRPGCWDVMGSADFWKDVPGGDGPTGQQIQNILTALEVGKPTAFSEAVKAKYVNFDDVPPTEMLDSWAAWQLTGTFSNYLGDPGEYPILYSDGTTEATAPTGDFAQLGDVLCLAFQ